VPAVGLRSIRTQLCFGVRLLPTTPFSFSSSERRRGSGRGDGDGDGDDRHTACIQRHGVNPGLKRRSLSVSGYLDTFWAAGRFCGPWLMAYG